jgi:hypothetical protein
VKIVYRHNPGWERYVAHSPALNLIRAARRDPDFRVEPAGAVGVDPHECDAILTDGLGATASDGCPTLYLVDDIHRFTRAALEDFRDTMARHDLVLNAYRFAVIPRELPHVAEAERAKMVVLPHSVPDDPPPADARACFAVTTDRRNARNYPMLASIADMELPGLRLLPHPGYADPAAMIAAREAWFPTLARHRVGLVGLGYGPGGYALAKYVEFLYAGCLLLAERPGPIDCEILGLRDGVNCFLFDWPEDRDRFLEVYHAAARDFAPFAPIAAAGQVLALERHTARHRLAYLRRIIAFFQRERRPPRPEEQIDLFGSKAEGEVPC